MAKVAARRAMVGKFWGGEDLEKILSDEHLTARHLLYLLRSTSCRSEIAARQSLARLQGQMIARQCGPEAVKQLTKVAFEEEKPEVRLKGMLAMLQIAGLLGVRKPGSVANQKVAAGTRVQTRQPLMNSKEADELLQAVAAELGRMRERAAMGEPPKGDKVRKSP